MGWKRKNESEEEAKTRQAAYMRGWLARRREKILAAPPKFCACGCGEPVFSYNRNAKYAKGHWTLGKEFGNTKRATTSPTLRQIEWAAGFLEGEGSFMATKGSRDYSVQVVTAKQNQREPLERLHQIFGGTLKDRVGKEVRFANREKVYRQKNYSVWFCHQTRARGIMMTLYSLMSPRRQEQIRKSLVLWTRRNVKFWELGPKKYREIQNNEA